MSLLMLVPSRGRPASAADLMDSVRETTDDPDTKVLFCVDDDDPTLDDYLAIPDTHIAVGPPNRIGPILNLMAPRYANDYTHIGFMGDDHRPRTYGWDEELCTEGVAYGNDLFQGPRLPTAVVMNSRIIEDLGYFCTPGAWHLFLDNSWLDIGHRYGLTYRGDVIIEHMHPQIGKAEWDEGYAANNSGETWTHDEKAYLAWKESW